MAESEFKPIEVLAGYLKDADPDKAVKLVRELCAQLEADPDSFHGGIWPGNVDLDVDGKAVLGPGSRVKPQERSAEQVEYMSPEYFLDGETSAAADVYSIGLMLYAACNDGFLPFQPKKADLTDKERADALRRRMKGEPIPMPEGISGELAKILEKTLAYEPDKRYITSSEFLSSLNRTDEALPTAAAVGAAAVAGAAAAGKGKEDPVPEPAEDIPHEPEAAEAPGEPEIDVSGAEDVGIETAAAAGGTGAGGETYAPRREYRVQKDFEKTPRAKRSPSTVPAAQRKRKKSGAVPVLAALAALALLGGAGYMIMKGGGDPTVSQPFVAATTAPTDEPDATPVVITPKPEKEPERTPKATEDPEQTPEASPETEPTPIPADAGTAAPTVTPDMSLPAGTAISAGGGSGASGTGSIGTVTSGSGGTTGSSGSTSTTGSGGTTGSTGASGSGGSSGSSGGSTGSSGSSTGVTPADGTVYLTGNLVRVRTGPGTGYSIIGHVSKGDSLVRTGTTANGWTQVNYNGRTGYVSSKYLTTTNPNATAAPTATPLPPPVASPDYQVVQEKANYAAALNEDLATVGSENDFTAITKALEDAGVTGGAWVGATYENGKWLWSDGTEFSAADKAHTDTSSPVEGGGVILIKDGDTWVYRAVDKTGEYAYVTTG